MAANKAPLGCEITTSGFQQIVRAADWVEWRERGVWGCVEMKHTMLFNVAFSSLAYLPEFL